MDNGQRDRDRSRRGDRPSRFSDAGGRDRSSDGKSDGRRIYVSNIPYDTRWSQLKDLFKEKVGDVTYVEIFNDDQGKPRGCGVVEFSNPESAKRAMEVMYRTEINGRKLVLKEEPGRNLKPQRNPVTREDKDKSFNDISWNRSDMDSTERFNTYGLSLQFLDSISVQPPLVNKVFAANLDYKVDRAKLKEIFKLAGKVRNIDLSLDKDGKSRGFAVIEFDHPVEAVQAISMFDRQMLFDRRMTVRMDRANSDKPLELRLPEGLKSIGLGLGPNGEPLRNVAQNLPSNQSQQQSNGAQSGSLGGGILGAVPTAGVGINGLGAAGLGANATLGSTALGLQALGLTGLGALQNQLLQSGLSGDLAGNLATALSAQQQLGLGQAGSLGVGALAGGLAGNLSGGLSGNIGAAELSRGGAIGMSGSNSYGGQGMGSSNVRGGGAISVGSFAGRGDPNTDDRNQNTSDMVVVSNLPPTVTWQILREKFSECGDVKFAEMTSKDTAIVRFMKQWDAERAVKMFDRTRIDGRTIEVRFF